MSNPVSHTLSHLITPTPPPLRALSFCVDPDDFVRVWAEGCTYMVPGQPIMRSKADVMQHAKQFLANLKAAGGGKAEFINRSFKCDPASASDPQLVTVTATFKLMMGGQSSESHGIGSLVKVNGEWLLYTVGAVSVSPETQKLINDKPPSA